MLLATGRYTVRRQGIRPAAVGRAAIAAALPGLAAVVMVGGTAGPRSPSPGMRDRGLRSTARCPGGERRSYEDVPFGHPLWVLYSSGTTGLPKAIVHSHGGIVLEHLKALCLQQDLGAGDVFFWYTTTGWMMWNYLVSGLLAGAAIVAYDGSATYPGTDALWRLAAATGVTYFGTGAPYLMACAKAGLSPGRELDLAALRGIGSTGSPLPPEGFRWVYERVGTGLAARLLLRRHRPVHRLRRPSPAAAGAGGHHRRPLPGRPGGGVRRARAGRSPARSASWSSPGRCRRCRPASGMTRAVTRYRASYFDAYPGVWRHGDWIMMLPDGGCVIFGRSDATLNRGGVRMGTSEFYRVVERLPEIADSLVVDTGQLGADGRLILYVVLAPAIELDDELIRPAQERRCGRSCHPARAGRDPPGAGRAADAVGQEARRFRSGGSCSEPRWRRRPTRMRSPTPRSSRCSPRRRLPRRVKVQAGMTINGDRGSRA